MSEPNKNIVTIKSDTKGKVISIVVLCLVLITVWHMLDLALLTFIITFIFYILLDKIQKTNKKYIPFRLPDVVVLSFLYSIIAILLVILSTEFMPKMILQFADISKAIINFDFNKLWDSFDPRLATVMKSVDFGAYIAMIGEMLSSLATKVGQFGVNVFIALILSFVLLAERRKIKQFGENLSRSKASFVYGYFIDFGGIFVKTFGKVMKVQITIAFVNAILSMIMLRLIGFPSVIGLGVMIFCLGLVPVAGVIVSMVPLCIIAFTIGGVIKIVEVVVMILLLHAIEAYILNPRLMANRVRLPVCFVFIVLLVAEHYIGVWGLLVGVPIFIFLMTIINVDYEVENKHKKRK